MNILITAIGSMSAKMVTASLQAVEGLNLFACDIHKREYLPLAEKFNGFYQIAPASEASMIDEILEICSKNNIHIIFPLTDPEVDRFAEARELFDNKNIKIATPSPETVKMCRNKWGFYTILKDVSEVQLIPTYLKKDLSGRDITFPIIAKPATGRSSQGLFKIHNQKMLKCFLDFEDYVFQEFIEGSIITVDIVRDKKGNIFSLARKELIRSANGAGLTVEVIPNDEYLQHAIMRICSALKIVGCINMEFIKKENNYFLMDINPRFSAGIAFSKLAGYDFAKQCLKIFTNREISVPPPQTIKYGVFAKYFEEKEMKSKK